jgi:murein DD-endopeptidase MepM/ murein hydrolase activator NlpD
MTVSARRLLLKVFLITALLSGWTMDGAAQTLRLILPTDNDALFDDDGPGFYMYTDRTFQGRRSRPWQGGQYGFVRNAVETDYGIVYTRFHEGADIRPVRRDRRNEPLDAVRAIDEGAVVYVNDVEKYSNYGKYIVVEHWWDGSPYYTLSAHLNAVYVREGQTVQQGDRLGLLGYTGVGINRRRAHVHFEINLLLNETFDPWYVDYFNEERDPNYHGIHSGLNMAGLDVPGLYLALRNNPALTIPAFLEREAAFFKVAVPNEGRLDLLQRYPWMAPALTNPAIYHGDADAALAWEISFAQSGFPLRIDPYERPVSEPVVTMIQESPISYELLTNRLIEGAGERYKLSKRGLRHRDLLTRNAHRMPHRVAW